MITEYGFMWGPVEVERLVHVEGQGYMVSVKAKGGEIQIYVSEKGHAIRAYKPGMGKLVPERKS